MGQPVLQLAVASNWQVIWNETYEAEETLIGRAYNPIVITAPVQAESPILRAVGFSNSAKPYWKKAYDLSVRADTGTGEIEVARHFVPLNTLTLVSVPDVAGSYNLNIAVPFWLLDLQVLISEYIGPIDDTTEQLVRESTEGLEILMAGLDVKLDEITVRLDDLANGG